MSDVIRSMCRKQGLYHEVFFIQYLMSISLRMVKSQWSLFSTVMKSKTSVSYQDKFFLHNLVCSLDSVVTVAV